MLNIALADWLLSRSEAFGLLLTKFRNHKLNTRRSFSKVKQVHNVHNKQIDILHKRLRTMENALRSMQEDKPKIIQKNK